MKRITNQSGAALIEFILVLVPLLVLLFGSIEFGVAGYNKAMITNAAREGARAGIVFNAAKTGNRFTAAEIQQFAIDYCAEHVITFGAANDPVVTVTPDPPPTTPGAPLTVTVTWDYGFLVLQNFIPGFDPTIKLGATSVMRME
jgi:Flp pilus assembly protein TadG